MRIKINGKDIDRVTINTDEGSDFAAWGVIFFGGLIALGWWLLWI